GSLQLGSFFYKIPIPFILGPVGGGQKSPVAFKKYFGQSWQVEQRRERTSDFLVKFSPACKKMIKKAAAVWVSNPDTGELVKNINPSNVHSTLDAALPLDFFPKEF